MHFTVEINRLKFILDTERLAALVAALDGVQQIETSYAGDGKGTSGHNNAYNELLVSKPLSEAVQISLLSESELSVLKLITESQKSA